MTGELDEILASIEMQDGVSRVQLLQDSVPGFARARAPQRADSAGGSAASTEAKNDSPKPHLRDYGEYVVSRYTRKGSVDS